MVVVAGVALVAVVAVVPLVVEAKVAFGVGGAAGEEEVVFHHPIPPYFASTSWIASLGVIMAGIP